MCGSGGGVAPPHPQRPRRLQVRSGAHAFTVSFTPPAGAIRTLIRVVASDGRRLQQVLTLRTRRLAVPVIGFGTQELPAFYSDKSGIALEHSAADAAAVARMLALHWGPLEQGSQGHSGQCGARRARLSTRSAWQTRKGLTGNPATVSCTRRGRRSHEPRLESA